MLRFYALLFIVVLLGSTLVRFFPQIMPFYSPISTPLLEKQQGNESRQIEEQKLSQETIPIYSIERVQSDFPCFQTTKNTSVLQHSANNAQKLQQIQKGQKLCYNFPQIIPNTTYYITLKAIHGQWVRVTIMGDSLLLSGYIPLQSLRNWQQIQADSLTERVNKSKLLFYAPKIISHDSKKVNGEFSMPLVLGLASKDMQSQDYESARSWLALAQQYDSAELAIYELYAQLLILEGRTSEGNQLIQIIQEFNNTPR